MANGIVNLVFRSIAQGSGFKDTLNQAREMKGEMGDLTESVKKLGGVAGQTGGLVGEMLSSALKGGIFGVIAAAVGVIVNLYGKWRDAARETAEAAKRAFDDRVKAVSDYIKEELVKRFRGFKFVVYDTSDASLDNGRKVTVAGQLDLPGF